MSTAIEIGKMDKRVNSTACQGFAGTSYDCVLKEGTDIRNPTFMLKGSYQNYNYAKWSDRYYWIDKVVSFPNGIIEATGHIDPLATYKNDIKQTYAFISYSHNIISPEVLDQRMQAEIVRSKVNTSASDIFDSTPTPYGGSVIVTCFEAGTGSQNQGVKTYALSIDEFKAMIQSITVSLYDSQYDVLDNNSSINGNLPNFTGPDDVANMLGALGSVAIHDMLKFFSEIMQKIGGYGSWRDNLIKAVYVPFDKSDIPANGTPKNIYLGFLDTRQNAKQVHPCYVKTKQTNIVIPWDSKCTDYHWLKYNKFSQLQAICGGGQYVNIDTDLLRDLSASSTLSVYSAVDVCSGDWSAALTKETSSASLRLASFGGNMGVDITGYAGKGLGAGMNMTQGALKIAGSVLSMGLSSSMESSIGESAGSIGTGIAAQFIDNRSGSVGSGVCSSGISSIFMNGSTGYNDLDLVAQCTIPTIIDQDQYDTYCQEYGYPCNQYRMLSDTWGGFAKCEGASVMTVGNQQDQAFINATLNSGIFLED